METGSVLDSSYPASLGTFDVVCSWGALHHTGDLWKALENATAPVGQRGTLFVALYNDQGWISGYSRVVERTENRGQPRRWSTMAVHAPYLFLGRSLFRTLSGRRRPERVMSLWYGMIDWFCGYPIETAHPGRLFHFFHALGSALENLKRCGGRHGCKELVFARMGENVRGVRAD